MTAKPAPMIVQMADTMMVIESGTLGFLRLGLRIKGWVNPLA